MPSRPFRSALALTAALAGAAGASVPALAARTTPAAALAPADKALVEKAAGYLQGLKSAQARFSQTDPRGAITTGVFSLQRPDRARFAYDPPAALTVVADGVNVDVADAKLKTFDQYPLKQTPLSLLLGDDVKLDKDAVVASAVRDKAGFAITLRDARKHAQGQLVLRFSNTPLALTGWTVLDGQGGRTTVTLSDLKSGVTLEPGLFVLHDPHPHVFKP